MRSHERLCPRPAVRRDPDRARPHALSPVGAGAARGRGRDRGPGAGGDDAVGRGLVRRRGALRRGRALPLSPGRWPCGARSRRARPGRRRPWAEPGRRSRRLSLAASRMARPAVARDRPLRAACRPAGRLCRRPGGAARPRGAGRHRCRADAGQRVSRHAQLGLRRRAAFRTRPQLRHAGRAEGAGRCRARPRPHDLPRRRLQSLRPGRELSRGLCARLLPGRHRHAVGRRHRLPAARGAPLLHRERALLAAGISFRRAALRRRARHLRGRLARRDGRRGARRRRARPPCPSRARA